MYSCRDWHLLQLMQRGTCYKEEVFLCHSVSEQWGRANSVQLGKTWILQRASVDVWDGVLISLATQTTCEINGVIPGLWDWMCCLFVCVCVSLWHGLWEEDSVISSVFWVLYVVLPVSYLQWQQNEKSVLTVFQRISAPNFTSEPSPLSREGDMSREGIYYTVPGNFFP